MPFEPACAVSYERPCSASGNGGVIGMAHSSHSLPSSRSLPGSIVAPPCEVVVAWTNGPSGATGAERLESTELGSVPPMVAEWRATILDPTSSAPIACVMPELPNGWHGPTPTGQRCHEELMLGDTPGHAAVPVPIRPAPSACASSGWLNGQSRSVSSL